MKYVIDLTTLNNENTGIENIAENATLSMIENNSSDVFSLIFYKEIPETFLKFKNDNNVRLILIPKTNLILMRLYYLPKTILKENGSFNLFFAFPSPLFVPQNKCVSVIHDLTAFKYPKTMNRLAALRWRFLIKRAVTHNRYILTVSDTIKNEISERFGRCDTKRIYPGIKSFQSYDDSIIDKLHLNNTNYIISVATLEPRKNLSLLISAFTMLHDEGINNLKLVLVGRNGWKIKESFKNINDNYYDDIIFAGYVSDDELASLYKHSKLYVSTSVYEGFGLPTVEALSLGVKVLLSDLDVYKEVAEDNALFFKSNDVIDLKNKILEGVNNSHQLHTNSIFEKFNWKSYGKELQSFLNSANRLLFVHNQNFRGFDGGGNRALQNYLGCMDYYYCDDFNLASNNSSIKNLFRLHFIYKRILKLLKQFNYSVVFFDTSLFGYSVKKISSKSNVKIIVHYHNFEKDYFKDKLRLNNTILNKIKNIYVCKSEQNASKYSDYQVYISENDKSNICKYYDIDNKNGVVVPPLLKDSFSFAQIKSTNNKYALFLGSSFYANDEAASYIINVIAPKSKINIVIAGKGMKSTFPDKYDNVEVLDYVEDLNELFANACCFLSPVFSGSGSKIKIAEALMHGKFIIGTESTFIGYDISKADVKICNDDIEFINALNSFDSSVTYFPKNRQLYENMYSYNNLKPNYSFLLKV